MRRLEWTKITSPDLVYRTQTADDSWAEIWYMSRTELAGTVWANADKKMREFYRIIEPKRSGTLREAEDYLRAWSQGESHARDAAETVQDAMIQAEALLRRYEITGILDPREAYEAMRNLPTLESAAKIAAWWARNPGADDPTLVAEEGSV